MQPEVLGLPTVVIGSVTSGGFLDSLRSGSANSLTENPVRALKILDEALNDVLDSRERLGAFAADQVDPVRRHHAVAMENLTASGSSLRDADFAAEAAALAREQVLFESGVAVLAQTTQIPQSVLELLRS
jgi:flagellin